METMTYSDRPFLGHHLQDRHPHLQGTQRLIKCPEIFFLPFNAMTSIGQSWFRWEFLGLAVFFGLWGTMSSGRGLFTNGSICYKSLLLLELRPGTFLSIIVHQGQMLLFTSLAKRLEFRATQLDLYLNFMK